MSGSGRQRREVSAYTAAAREAHRVLRPDGALVLANVARADRWICNGQEFPARYLDARILRRTLEEAGFAVFVQREIASKDAAHRDQGYSRMLVTAATRRR